jgi:hypothetical protein
MDQKKRAPVAKPAKKESESSDDMEGEGLSDKEDRDEEEDKVEVNLLKNCVEFIKEENKGISPGEKTYGLPILWKLMQDNTNGPSNTAIVEAALNALDDVLKNDICKKYRLSYLFHAISNLSNG